MESDTPTQERGNNLFTVSGTYQGVPYNVGVHPEGLPDGTEGAVGIVMGSGLVTTLLDFHNGLDFARTPVSDTEQLDNTDPTSVLAFLYDRTNVTTVEGDDVPDITPEDTPPGAIQ